MCSTDELLHHTQGTLNRVQFGVDVHKVLQNKNVNCVLLKLFEADSVGTHLIDACGGRWLADLQLTIQRRQIILQHLEELGNRLLQSAALNYTIESYSCPNYSSLYGKIAKMYGEKQKLHNSIKRKRLFYKIV